MAKVATPKSKNTDTTANKVTPNTQNAKHKKDKTMGRSSKKNEPKPMTSGHQVTTGRKTEANDPFQEPIRAPTEEWFEFLKSMDESLSEGLEAFKRNEEFGDNGNSAHDFARKGRQVIEIGPRANLTVNRWKTIFKKAMDNEAAPVNNDIRTFLYKLSLTDPTKAFSSWKDRNLMPNDHTNAWSAAYMLMGAPWRNRDGWWEANQEKKDETNEVAKPIKTTNKETEARPKKSVGFDTAIQQGRRYGYLSKPLKENKSSIDRRLDGKKFTTFYKLKLPKIEASEMQEQEKEALKWFDTALKCLWKQDGSVIIHPWKEYTNLKPIKSEKQLPKNKARLEDYVERLWLSQNRAPYLRILLGHNKTVEEIDTDEVYEEYKSIDIQFSKEPIQDRAISKVGWLLGSHPGAFNSENMQEALRDFASLKNVPLETRFEPIQLTLKGKRTDVRALHLHTSYAKAAEVRKALKVIYSSTSNDFPLGMQCRFIPNTLDARYITTPMARAMAKKAVSKQRTFLKSTNVQRSRAIVGLDYVVDKYGISLRQAVLGLRSVQQDGKPLFVSCEEYANSQTVAFVYKQDMEREVLTAIPALPVILEAKLGPNIWTWFDDEARLDTEDYMWDDEKGVVSKEEMHLEGKDPWAGGPLEDLEDSEAEEDTKEPDATQFHMTFELDLEQKGPNQFNDNGTIATKVWGKEGQEPTEVTPKPSNPPEHKDGASNSTSTLTKSTDDTSQLERLLQDPELRLKALGLLSQHDPKQSERTDTSEHQGEEDTREQSIPPLPDSPKGMEIDKDDIEPGSTPPRQDTAAPAPHQAKHVDMASIGDSSSAISHQDMLSDETSQGSGAIPQKR